MVEAHAIILAAGLSRRMGVLNKLLLDWHGQPMVRHVVTTYLDAIGPHVTVVLGHQADRLRTALADLPVQFVDNPAFEQGQYTSVAAGLRAAENAQAVLIGLGDQPLLTAADLSDLLAEAQRAPDRITIPMFDGQRGNPIVVPGRTRPQLLEDRQRPGCKRFIQANPDLVHKAPLRAAGFYTDIDTPEAYSAYQGGEPYENLH